MGRDNNFGFSFNVDDKPSQGLEQESVIFKFVVLRNPHGCYVVNIQY